MINWIISNFERVAPMAIFSLQVIATFGYILKGDYPRALYWVGASILVFSLTFLIK